MKKTTTGNGTSSLRFEKESLRRMNQDRFVTIDANELDKATGGYSLRCPDCALSSTNYGAE